MTTRPAIVRRDYAPLLAHLGAHGPRAVLTDAVAREAAMSKLVTELWESFKDQHLSWIGFYAKVEGTDEMVLVCREPKPACSPIGLHGMCGRGWQERRSIVIQDVRTLGENYIACDPKDQSEVVVPVLNADGSCWGGPRCRQLRGGRVRPGGRRGTRGVDRENGDRGAGPRWGDLAVG